MNIANLLCRSGCQYDVQPAIALGDRVVLNYGQLAKKSAIIAKSLQEKFHLVAGDRVAIVAGNCPEYVELLFAIWHAGLIAAPINSKLHQNEYRYLIEHSGAKVCFVSKKLSHTFSNLLTEIESFQSSIVINSPEYLTLSIGLPTTLCEKANNDPAWLFYTSGTTGKPKGAMISHHNLWVMTQGYFSDIDTISIGDCIIHAAPMSHGSGFYILPHIAKGAINVIPESGGFNEQELVDLISCHKGVSMFAAPTMVKRFVKYIEKTTTALNNLKTIVYGGGPMYQNDLALAHQVFGNKLVQMYGQGECPMNICVLSKFHHDNTSNSEYKRRLASIGVPILGVEVKIADEEGEAIPEGEVGEILVRSDAVMLGYFNNLEATDKTICDGWLRTGDMAIQSHDGFISLVDRAKDVIISGGSNIYPREVEEILNNHPNVLEASVIGQVDPDWGEIVVAVVVVKPNLLVNEVQLDSFCLEHMTRFKRPKAYVFVDVLPKNSTGKILKTELRKTYDRSHNCFVS